MGGDSSVLDLDVVENKKRFIIDDLIKIHMLLEKLIISSLIQSDSLLIFQQGCYKKKMMIAQNPCLLEGSISVGERKIF